MAKFINNPTNTDSTAIKTQVTSDEEANVMGKVKSDNFDVELKYEELNIFDYNEIFNDEKTLNNDECGEMEVLDVVNECNARLTYHTLSAPDFRCSDPELSESKSTWHHDDEFKLDLTQMDCDTDITSNSELQDATLQPSVKEFKCDLCPAEFMHLKSLRVHQRLHSGENALFCDQCDRTFTCFSHLQRHKKTHSTEKTFSEANKLEVHDCAEKPPYVFTICKREKPHICDVCGKTFRRSGILKKHVVTHTNEKSYPCNICDKVYSESRELKVHLYEHTGKTPFFCRVCGKGFTRSCNLKSHERTHTGEKPHVCGICVRNVEVTVCNNERFKLQCPPKKVLNLVFAFCGRKSVSICPVKNPIMYKENSVSGVNWRLMKKTCNKKNACTVKSVPHMKSPICSGGNKYLVVTYMCV